MSAPTIADAARRLRVRVVLPDRSPFLAVLVSVGGRSRGRRWPACVRFEERVVERRPGAAS